MRYRMISLGLSAGPGLISGRGHDTAGNLETVTDNLVPGRSLAFEYDDLGRLRTSTRLPAVTRAFQYDSNANRTFLTDWENYQAEMGTAALEQELSEAGPRSLSEAWTWLDAQRTKCRAQEARQKAERKRQQSEQGPSPAPTPVPNPKRCSAGLLVLLTIAWVVIGVVLWATLERRLWGAAKDSTATTTRTTATASPTSTRGPRPTPIPAPVLEAGATWVEPGVGMRFRYIPAGTFEMGRPPGEAGPVYDDEQQHQVRLSRGYWMGETEVTQGQWKALKGSNPSHFSSCSEDNPVEAVSWFDAVSYANALSSKGGFEPCYEISGESVSFVGLECEGFRLPTEAEWEYGARSGGSHRYAGSDSIDAVAWYGDNSGGKTHRVGSKRANGWGLSDMSGNVREWCWDWYEYPIGSSNDPTGPPRSSYYQGIRVIRGGSWLSFAMSCRSATRFSEPPGDRDLSLGFRLVRTAH